MRSPALVATAVALMGCHALAQAPPSAPARTATNTPFPLEQEPNEKAWSFSAAAFTYIVPDSRDYVQPTLAADRGWLHLEARYNYEDLETGSAWFGYNFSGGRKLAWEFTPMIGGVVGTTAGVAPGYKFFLGYSKFELASESEYVIDARDTAESFLYTWSELSISPLDWFRAGAVVQRTRAYRSDRDVQRGLLVGVAYGNVGFTTYVFNPDESRPIVVLAVDFSF